MAFDFAAVIAYDDPVDEVWLPRVAPGGAVTWGEGDGEVVRLEATGVSVYRGSINKGSRAFHVENLKITLHVSRTRLVLVCVRYDKGGGWIGTPTEMLVANAVSMARAAYRRRGQVLVGQVRWPWVASVGYQPKEGLLTSSVLHISVLDGRGDATYVRFALPRRQDARAAAQAVLDAAAGARASYPYLTADDRANLESLTLPPYDPGAGRISIVKLPAPRRAAAETAFPDASRPSPSLPPPVEAPDVGGGAEPDHPAEAPAPTAEDGPPGGSTEQPSARERAGADGLPPPSAPSQGGARSDPGRPPIQAPGTLTAAQWLAYSNVAGSLRRVVADGEQAVDGVVRPILLNGPSPVCGPDEQEVGRFGVALDLTGAWLEEDESVAGGQIARAAAHVLVTSERVSVSLVHGDTIAGEARRDRRVVVFDYPWDLVAQVSMPQKTTVSDRIAGAKPVTVELSLEMAHVEMRVVAASEMSVPPDSEPVRKARAEDLMRALVTAGGRHRLRTATGPEAERIGRLLEGDYEEEDGSLVAHLAGPDEEPADDVAVTAVAPTPPAAAPEGPLAGAGADRDSTAAATAPREAAPRGRADAVHSRRGFRALAASCGALLVGAVVLMAITISGERSGGDRTGTTSAITSTEAGGSPGAVAGAESPAETVQGDGYEFQVPAGPGWSVGEPTTANGDALVERRINGPGGIVVRVVHTPRERARPDPDAVVSVAPFESAVPDSEVFTVSGFPTAECERTTCDDFVLNSPEFGGLAFLASDSGGPASQAARTMAGTLSVGGASPEGTGYVIGTSDDSPAQFGSFRDDGGSPAGRALRGAFGEPTSQTPSERGCDLQWVAIGVTAELTTFGQDGVDACEDGYFVRARLSGAMWRTPTMLRVGSPVEEADAEDVCAPRGSIECAGDEPFYPDGSTLAVHDIECAPGQFPSVIATATGGRVDGFWVYTDSCE